MISIDIGDLAAAKKELRSEVAAVQRLWAAGIPMTCAAEREVLEPFLVLP